MEQSLLWEDNNRSTSQKILVLLWKLKALFYIHNSLQIVSILNRMSSIYIGQLCVLQVLLFPTT